MRLFIRGAWRSFGEGHHEDTINDSDAEVTRRIDQRTVVAALPPSRFREQGPSTRAICLGIISTKSLPKLKLFYLAFSDDGLMEAEDQKCSIWIDRSHYITLTSNEYASREDMTQDRPLVINLDVGPAERLAAFYSRMKAKEIAPVHSLLDGHHLVVQYEDPDRNVFNIYAEVLTGTDSVSSSLSIRTLQEPIHADPEVLLEAFRTRRGKEKVSDIHSVTVRIKTEPIAAE